MGPPGRYSSTGWGRKEERKINKDKGGTYVV